MKHKWKIGHLIRIMDFTDTIQPSQSTGQISSSFGSVSSGLNNTSSTGINSSARNPQRTAQEYHIISCRYRVSFDDEDTSDESDCESSDGITIVSSSSSAAALTSSSTTSVNKNFNNESILIFIPTISY